MASLAVSNDAYIEEHISIIVLVVHLHQDHLVTTFKLSHILTYLNNVFLLPNTNHPTNLAVPNVTAYPSINGQCTNHCIAMMVRCSAVLMWRLKG